MVVAVLPLFASPVYAQRSDADSADWKRGAVCYEVFVRSFYDSDGDGIGDLNGLTQKLDYINDGNPATRRDLGARCVWLMPVAASPSYHGYDVTNYYRVNPQYGTNDDFKRFVAEAHRRGIRVLVDMVLNHASNEHPYFKDALLNPSSPYRSWFRFSATDPKTKGPWGENHIVWHRSPVRDEYYYGIFWHGMPDLNYETPAVRQEAKEVARFWLEEMGVDGFRLDAIPYLVEEGTRYSGTPGTHAFLREYASYIRTLKRNAFTVGEVWDSLGAMLPYYPDQLEAHFAFEAADAIINAVRSVSASKLFPAYLRLQKELPPERWAPFLRNHDQTRTMTELGGDYGRAKLAATLLLTLPGMPFVYYGEEIGMTGTKPDERLRTPMHWTRGRAVGFTTGIPWQPLHQDSLTANIDAQDADPNSLLNLYRRLVHLRSEHRALGVGDLVQLVASSDSVVAFLRRDGERTVLVIVNLAAAPTGPITLSSRDAVLSPGRYSLTPLVGSEAGADLRVSRGGRLEAYMPIRSLAPSRGYLFALSRRP
jgi:glycosidase